MQKIIIIFVIALLSVTAMAQNKKVAVFDPAGNVDTSMKEIIREEISSIIVNAGGYTVLERQLIDRVLEENRFQAGGLVDDSQMSEMGRRMGANMVFVTSMTTLDVNIYISCKLIDVETARIEKQRTALTQRGANDLLNVVQKIVGEMFDMTNSAGLTDVIKQDSKPKIPKQTNEPASKNVEYNFGFVIGVNSEIIEDNIMPYYGNSYNILKFTGGLAFRIIWPKELVGLVLQPEILYSQTEIHYLMYEKNYYHYLKVPVNMMYRLQVAEVKPFALIAPYGIFAFKGDTNNDGIFYYYDRNYLWSYGISVGAGFDVWKIQLSYNYSWGFGDHVHNNVYTISAGIFF